MALELEAPSPERGLAFAQKFCSNCHLVEGGGSATVQAGIPSLRGLANKPGQNGERIRNVLINPHPPMPDMQVSQQEILDVLAYLETLRTDKSAPPFLSPAQQGDEAAVSKALVIEPTGGSDRPRNTQMRHCACRHLPIPVDVVGV